MAFKVPKQYRLTKELAKTFSYFGPEMLKLFSDDEVGNNGFFLVPKPENVKSRWILVKAVDNVDAKFVSCVVPADGFRAPRYHELHHVVKLFWDSPEDTVFIFMSNEKPFVSTKNWVHMFQVGSEHKRMLPLVMQTNDVRDEQFKISFFRRLYAAIVKAIKNK